MHNINQLPICPEPWCGMNVTMLADSLALEIKEKHTVDKFIFPCPKILIAAHQACAWGVVAANIAIERKKARDEYDYEKSKRLLSPFMTASINSQEWRKWAEEQSK